MKPKRRGERRVHERQCKQAEESRSAGRMATWGVHNHQIYGGSVTDDNTPD